MPGIPSLRNSVSVSVVRLLQGSKTDMSKLGRHGIDRSAIFSDDRAGRAVANIIQILLDARGNADVGVSARYGTVSVTTGKGDDRITIDAQAADIVASGAGDDFIAIHTGGRQNRYGDYLLPAVDRVDGGAGDDTIAIATHGGAARVEGGSGNDLIHVVSTSNAYNRSDFFTGVDNVDGGSGNDGLVLSATLDVTRIDGGSGNDAISISAGRSADIIDGGDGNDALSIVAAGASRIDAGTGDDAIAISAASVWLVDGGDGNDAIAVAGRDVSGVRGGAGDDVISVSAKSAKGIEGGDGNDTIAISAERISVRGGAGNDHIVLNGSGSRAAMVYMAEGDGHDVVESNVAITIGRFNDSGTMQLDMSKATVARNDDGTLTVSFGDSADTLTVKLTGEMADRELAFDYDRSGRALTIRAAEQPVKMLWE